MLLEEIVDSAEMENGETEFKGKLDRNDIIGWLKTIAGFANAHGGDMYIGVEDKTHKLMGFDRNTADKERNYFNNQVNEHIFPRPEIKITFLKYTIRGQERYVLRARVPVSPVRPVVLRYKNVPSIFMRRDGFTNGATYEEIIEMSQKSSRVSFDAVATDIKYERRHFSVLMDFFERHAPGKKLTDKALGALGFFDENKMLSNGAALFSDGYKGDKTAMICSVFSGFNKGSERIVTVNRFKGPITESIDFACDFIAQRMNHTLIKTDNGRENIDAYPARSVLEAVVNAVAHRDYYLDGTQITIDMFRDRLEISSPGSFFRGETIKKTFDLSSIISKRRNEIICGVLVACNVMEAAGTGFDKIMEDYAEADDRHRPYIFSTSDHFTLVLPDLTYAEGDTSGGSPELTFVPVPNGTKYDGKILEFCYENAHKAPEIAAYIGISNSSYFRGKVLQNLVRTGYLLIDSQSRVKYYRTNPEMVEKA